MQVAVIQYRLIYVKFQNLIGREVEAYEDRVCCVDKVSSRLENGRQTRRSCRITQTGLEKTEESLLAEKKDFPLVSGTIVDSS